MKLPWPRRSRTDRLVLGYSDMHVTYLQAEGQRLLRCGVELRGQDDDATLARRLRALDLPAQDVTAVLELGDCQLLQIEAPAVPPAELKAAARWKIKDMVDVHLDELTLDVMPVGDGRQKSGRQLFVAAACSRRVRELSEWTQAARLKLAVIDIREAAQRNLQSALAAARGQRARAHAALMVHGGQCLLTVCAQDELFYARRLDWHPEWLEAHEVPRAAAATAGDRPVTDFSHLDIVDYGAEDEADLATLDDAPPLVIELQRSLDVWERSWPDLPLERLTVYANGQTEALAALLESALPLPVEPLDVRPLFPDFAARAGTPELASAAIPLLGALLRTDNRQL